jgi:hypothetical protein
VRDDAPGEDKVKKSIEQAQFQDPIPDGFSAFTGQVVGELSGSKSPGSPSRSRSESPTFVKDSELSDGWLNLRGALLDRFKSGKRAFRQIDSNDSGSATYGEMQEAMDRLRVPWREITLDDHLKHVFRGHPKATARGGGEFTLTDLFPGADQEPESDGEEEDVQEQLEAWFSNPDLVRSFAEWAAIDNRWENFYRLFHDTNEYSYLGCIGRRAATSLDFENTCRWLRFGGEAWLIFKEVQSQGLTMREHANRRKKGKGDFIYAKQMYQFEKKAKRLIETRWPEQRGSAIDRFEDHLRGLRGTVLAAWRLDVDLHSTGKVAYMDFSTACRTLQLSTQCSAALKCLRAPSRSDAIEFGEIGRQEAENIEQFCDALWGSCGCNFEQAFSKLDTHKQNWLTQKQFVAGAVRLGFFGDAKQLFQGLRTPGIDRMCREEFFYLKKVSNTATRRLPKSSALTDELITWVQSYVGGPENLTAKLGFTPANPTIGVSDLAARLTAMGFAGDSLSLASRAARLEGGTSISAESLRLLVTGERRTMPSPVMYSPVLLCSARKRGDQKDWNNGVDDISQSNAKNSKHERKFFSAPGPFSPPPRSASTGTLERRSTLPGEAGLRYRKSIIRTRNIPLGHAGDGKTTWDDSITCAKAAHFFHSMSERPALAGMQERLKHKRLEAASKVAEQRRKQFDTYSHIEVSAGEKVLLCVKAMLDEHKMRVVQFMTSLDQNGDGELDVEELHGAVNKLGFAMTDDEIEDLMLVIDADGGGTVTIKELNQAMRNTQKKANALFKSSRR